MATLLVRRLQAGDDIEGSPAVYWLMQEFNEAGRHLYDNVAELTPFITYARPPK